MIGLRFAVMIALVPLMGGWVAAFASVRALPRAARIASYIAAGIVTIAVEMFVLAAVGVPWNVVLLPIVGTLVVWFRGRGGVATPRPRDVATLVIAAAALLIVAATVLAGAATSFDLLLFWGVKGQRFGVAHTIDVAFLRDPQNRLMHPDYPPLVPLLYAWTMLGGIELDWFGTIATAPLLLSAGALAVWGFTRSAPMTALYATIFGFAFLDNNIAGNAEPMLLFLATVALFASSDAVAAIALTGVVLTKVEGAPLVAVALLVLPRRRIVLAPALALVAWLAFCAHHGLLDSYRGHALGSLHAFTLVAKPLLVEASMHAFYLPWLALAVLASAGRVRAALPALLAAAAYVAFLVVVWAGGEEANIVAEIGWSARRVLIVPLLLAFYAAVTSNRSTAT
jgi:hypothetical protein